MTVACTQVQNRLKEHFFHTAAVERERESHEDPFFTEGLLSHMLRKTEAGRYASACLDCWRAYHDFRAHAHE